MQTLYISKIGEIRTKEYWINWMYNAIKGCVSDKPKNMKHNMPDIDNLWDKAYRILELEEYNIEYDYYLESNDNMIKQQDLQ